MKDVIRLAHGNGGKLSWQLIKEIFLPILSNPHLAPLRDSAIVEVEGKKIAFTTDSYVVKPIFFPGGDIGKLAISGTVNDLTVMGAKPLFISCGLIIEEGFPIPTLKRVITSLQETAKNVGVTVVTGDTKVVEKGSADEIFINTSGIGIVLPEANLDPERIKVGDHILINGSIGEHAIAVLSQRQELGFEVPAKSDCAPLFDLINEVRSFLTCIKFMRDATRGGVAGVLNEIVQGEDFGIELWEDEIPVREETFAVCELLGLDPLYLANEGKILIFVEKERSLDLLSHLHHHPLGKDTRIIGEVVSEPRGKVYLETTIGTKRILDLLVEDQLPRIC